MNAMNVWFKAKRKDTDEWIYGYYVLGDRGTAYIVSILREDDFNRSFYYEIDPDTLCMWTRTIDVHGNKIFENDIVRVVDKENALRGNLYKVVWYEKTFVLRAIYRSDENFEDDYFYPDCWREVEVVGNWFDYFGTVKDEIAKKWALFEFYTHIPYPITVYPEEDGGYVVVIEDLPGCATQVEEAENVIYAIDEAKILWIATALKIGRDIPVPNEFKKLKREKLKEIGYETDDKV